MQLAAGIDIGGTNTRFGLVDKNGKIHFTGSVLTTDFADPKDLAGFISEKILVALNSKSTTADASSGGRETANRKLIGVGIGAPNGNFFKGTVELAPNLKWKEVVPLAKYFNEKLN